MTGASCRLVAEPIRRSEREAHQDRVVELLDCLADLRVHAGERIRTLSRRARDDDPRVREAVRRLSDMQEDLATVAAKVASVHQALQREHLI